jgi:hypothetical protein
VSLSLEEYRKPAVARPDCEYIEQCKANWSLLEAVHVRHSVVMMCMAGDAQVSKRSELVTTGSKIARKLNGAGKGTEENRWRRLLRYRRRTSGMPHTPSRDVTPCALLIPFGLAFEAIHPSAAIGATGAIPLSLPPTINTMSSKILRSANAPRTPPTDIELQIGQALIDLESNVPELKAELRQLQISAAKEVDVKGGKKAVVVFVPVPMAKAFHKVQQRCVLPLRGRAGTGCGARVDGGTF